MALSRLRELTVARFGMPPRREMLFTELERLVADPLMAAAPCELWINGSFMTEKQDPNDVDLSFVMKALDFDKLDTSVKSAILVQLNGDKKYSPFLDTYICIQYVRDDPRKQADTSDYWASIWGVGWDSYLKGYAVIGLGESDVGNRLVA